MLANFFIVQIGSALFACATDDRYSVGAEPLIFGYLGCIYAMFAHDFGRMGEFENALCAFVMVIILTVIAVFMLVTQASTYVTYTLI
jgi:membrane associated rhomboid family serine protease